MTETRATPAARRGLARAGRARAGARGARGSSRCSTRTSFEPARLAFQGARVSRTTAAAARHGGRRFGARGGGKRGGAPREHLQLLHAAVVSLIVETTFARHICGRERAGRRSEHARDVRDLPAARRARTRHREKKLGKIAVRDAAGQIDRNTARPPGATRLGTPLRPEVSERNIPETASTRAGRDARSRRASHALPRARPPRETLRVCSACSEWGRADLFARMRAVRAERSPFGLRLRNRAFVTKGTCDARGRRAAKVSDVAARRVSRRGTSGGCALAIFGRRVV